MGDFKNELRAYKNMIEKHSDFLKVFSYDTNESELFSNLLCPTNEEELRYANLKFANYIDMIILRKYGNKYEVKFDDFENTVIANLINNIYSSDSFNLLDFQLDVDTYASFIYESFMLKLTNKKVLDEYLLELTHCDYFNLLRIINVISSPSFENIKPDLNDLKSATYVAEKLHLLYQEKIASIESENNINDINKIHIKKI